MAEDYEQEDQTKEIEDNKSIHAKTWSYDE
jgi:hypothetical protein